MSFDFLWWHWAVFGCVLLAAEIFLINSSVVLWFGLGAILMAALVSVVAITPWLQLLLFAALSLLMLVGWLKILRPMRTAKQAQAAKRALPGNIGFVVNYNNNLNEGRLRLQRPIGGKDVWAFRSGGNWSQGDKVTIRQLGDDGIIEIEESAGGRDEDAAAPVANKTALQ